MNISLNCNVSLSKKLRALMGKEGSVTLIVSEIKDGKGVGSLSLTGDGISFDNESFKGETSIQLEPAGEIKLENGEEDRICSNIFSSVPNKGHSENVVSKLAVVNAPEKTQVSTSIKTKQQINKEASIASTIPPLAKKWISDMEQLIQVVNKAKTKHSSIDIDLAQTDREREVLTQMKEKEEAIDVEAWVVNEKYGNLSVNDLGIALPMGVPYDLSNVSARRLAASKDLRVLIRDGYVKFVSPNERDMLIQRALGGSDDMGIGSLPVFDNHEDAMEAIDKKMPVIAEDAVEITEDDIERPTEEEDSILNLTQNMPLVKKPRPLPEPASEESLDPVRTVHGSSTNAQLKAPPKPAFKRAF